MDLRERISGGESETVEFKESLQLKDEIGESVSAFSNSKGGVVLVGVSDKGAVKGIQIGKKTVADLAEYIKRHTDPQIFPQVKVYEIDSKQIILIKIKESAEKPVFFKNHAYKRVGDTNQRISSSEIRKLAKESGGKIYWDSLACEDAALANIDWDAVNSFIKKYEKVTEKELKTSPENLLKSLGCIKDNMLTNAGALFFSQNPQEFFMNAYIAVARYKGISVGTERLDYREFKGNIFHQIDACDRYIKEHIATLSRLSPMKVEREDMPEYPYFSIRELIVNAVCHRDYFDQTSKVIIKMFNDRMEYYNPGGLPEEVTPENIVQMQKSRNPFIAKVLARVRYIEELGEGWDRIMEEFKAHPLMPEMPEIRDMKTAVMVIIYAARLDTLEQFKDRLTEREMELLKELKTDEEMKSGEYAKLFSISERQARNDLSNLVKMNLLVKKGKARQIIYQLNPEVSGSIRQILREY
ncbi:MAG: putative DNA binding domain-containing protein [bacterium]|nr:putative DNA binding domain-containing protein [bacterium]